MSNTDHDKDLTKDLEALLLSMDKEFGKGYVNTLDGDFLDVPKLSTGSVAIDLQTGGGYPVGKITVISGGEGSGKSTFALQAVARESQTSLVAIIDTEHALNIDYLEALGVKRGNCMFVQPDTLEDAIRVTRKLVESGKISLFLFDSIAAAPLQIEIQGELTASDIGVKARMMGKFTRILVPAMSKTDCTGIFINQVREKPGVVYGSPETEPASKAINFAAFLKMKFSKSTARKNKKDEAIGHDVKVEVVKNKAGAPRKGIEIPLIYGQGFDKHIEIIDIAVRAEVLKRSGAYYSYGEVRLGQGADAAAQFLYDNPELFDEILEKVKEAHQ